MRLIDADKLKEAFSCCATLGGLLGEVIDKITEWAIKIVDSAPTIEIEKEIPKVHIHLLKIYPEYANEIVKGRKTFEVRYNDRDYKEGDLIQFTVISHEGQSLDGYSIHYRKYRIKYILNNFVGLKKGYIAFAIEEV